MKRLISTSEINFAPGEDTFGLKVWKETWDAGDKTKTIWKYELPNAVLVIPFTADGRIIAIKEKVTPQTHEHWKLVGETMESGEDAITTARRGLQEETGYESGRFTVLTRVFENSGRSNRMVEFVLARECEKVSQPESGIKVEIFTLGHFWDQLMKYLLDTPCAKHEGSNTLKGITLAIQHLDRWGEVVSVEKATETAGPW